MIENIIHYYNKQLAKFREDQNLFEHSQLRRLF